MIWLLAAIVIVFALAGITTIALCVSAGRADEEIREMFERGYR